MFEKAKIGSNTTHFFMQPAHTNKTSDTFSTFCNSGFYDFSKDNVVQVSNDFTLLKINKVADAFLKHKEIDHADFKQLETIISKPELNKAYLWDKQKIWVHILNVSNTDITLMLCQEPKTIAFEKCIDTCLIENNQAIGILCDSTGLILETTKNAVQVLGAQSNALLGNYFHEIESIKENEFSFIDSYSYSAKKSNVFELTVKVSQDKLKLFKFTSYPLEVDSCSLICFVGEDISEVTELVQSLNKSKELYNLITQYASDDIILIEKNKVVYVSPQYYSKVSIDLKSISEHDIYGIMQMLIHPDDIEDIGKQVYQDEINLVKKTTYCYRLKTKSGEYRWNEDEVYREFDKDGNGLRTVINSRNIDNRMKMVKALESSEERFRKIIHLTPNIAIQIFDSSGRIIDWNKASESMYKYTKKEVVGKTFGEVIFKDESQNQRFLNQLKTIKNSGKAFDPKEYMVYDKNQNEIYILSTTYPLPSDNDSEINEFICMDVDISELKKTQLELEKSKQALIIKNEKLLQAKEKIEVADRLKMSFLANVSHEIRTPMNAIIGFSQLLLLNDVSEEERLEYADYILKRSNDLLQLINDILDVSRIESGEMPLNPKFFQISNLLSHIFENYSMKSRFTNKSIEIKLDIEENLLEEKCYQDEERLKQILVNLLENAFKFTEKGSIEIACKKYENDSIDFIVRDTGIGISKDKINQIFNPFVQADSNHATRKYGGTGLGLSIVKGLCELIQGEIIVESEINKGSVFTIRVPQMLSLLKNE